MWVPRIASNVDSTRQTQWNRMRMESEWKEENVQLWPKSICSTHASTWLHLTHTQTQAHKGAHVVYMAHDSIEMKNDSEVRQPVQRESKTNKTKSVFVSTLTRFLSAFLTQKWWKKKKKERRNEMERKKEKRDEIGKMTAFAWEMKWWKIQMKTNAHESRQREKERKRGRVTGTAHFNVCLCRKLRTASWYSNSNSTLITLAFVRCNWTFFRFPFRLCYVCEQPSATTLNQISRNFDFYWTIANVVSIYCRCGAARCSYASTMRAVQNSFSRATFECEINKYRKMGERKKTKGHEKIWLRAEM